MPSQYPAVDIPQSPSHEQQQPQTREKEARRGTKSRVGALVGRKVDRNRLATEISIGHGNLYVQLKP